jgi:type I restriction enzyme S subunit
MRIVQILQKADDIRCKRKEALELADMILPATFHDIFGDPGKAEKLNLLGEGIESICNGLSRRRKSVANEGQIVLRIQDVGDGATSR